MDSLTEFFTGISNQRTNSLNDGLMGTSFKNPYIDQMYQYQDIIITSDNKDKFREQNLPGAEKEIIVDLGCGSGNFLRDYARIKPHSQFIGFELRFKRLVKGAIKLRKHGVTNVRLIRAKAEEIASWIKPNSVYEINVNFPDPWAKKRQLKHRLITSEYLTTIHSLLIKKGFFVFKTDHKEYFDQVNDLLRQQTNLDVIEYSEDLHQSEFNAENIPTEFELLFKGKGYPVYYLKSQNQ